MNLLNLCELFIATYLAQLFFYTETFPVCFYPHAVKKMQYCQGTKYRGSKLRGSTSLNALFTPFPLSLFVFSFLTFTHVSDQALLFGFPGFPAPPLLHHLFKAPSCASPVLTSCNFSHEIGRSHV